MRLVIVRETTTTVREVWKGSVRKVPGETTAPKPAPLSAGSLVLAKAQTLTGEERSQRPATRRKSRASASAPLGTVLLHLFAAGRVPPPRWPMAATRDFSRYIYLYTYLLHVVVGGFITALL